LTNEPIREKPKVTRKKEGVRPGTHGRWPGMQSCLGSQLRDAKVITETSLMDHSLLFFLSSAVLGLELRAFTLSHSTSPIFVKGFSR
jgi:hypothetical protein